MPFSDQYRRQVALLVRALPYVADEDCFALKGGTAINLFVRDMPRLSVDVDLTYLPVKPRPESLEEIDTAMKRIASRLRQSMQRAHIHEAKLDREEAVNKLIVRVDGVQIKVEVTPVARGCVFEPEIRSISHAVELAFGFAEIKVVSFADLYGGKLVASLDRQHPRDLFDVRDLLANEGINDSLRRAFVVYLLSHKRPISEILVPKRKDISHEFTHGFAGMTDVPVTLDELLEAREALVSEIVSEMPEDHRNFLVEFVRGTPDWSLLNVDGVEKLPAVLWRQQNLNKLDARHRAELAELLEQAFN